MLSELCPAATTAASTPVVLHIGYGAAAQALPVDNSSLLAGLGDEGYALGVLHPSSSQPPAAYVVAGGENSARGMLYAVYELLHQLGVRFYAWDETHFPACPSKGVCIPPSFPPPPPPSTPNTVAVRRPLEPWAREHVPVECRKGV